MHFVETNHTIVSSLCSFSNSLMFFLYCSLVDLDIITNMFLVSLPRVKMWFHVFFYLFYFIEYLKFNTKKKKLIHELVIPSILDIWHFYIVTTYLFYRFYRLRNLNVNKIYSRVTLSIKTNIYTHTRKV